NHAPVERAAVALPEAEVVEVGEDALAADQGAIKMRQLGGQQVVEVALAIGGLCGVLGAFALVAATAGHGQALLADGRDLRRERRATRSAADAAARSRPAVSSVPRAAASAACSRRIQARRAAASRARASASADGAASSGHAAASSSGTGVGRPTLP